MTNCRRCCMELVRFIERNESALHWCGGGHTKRAVARRQAMLERARAAIDNERPVKVRSTRPQETAK